MIAPFVGRLRFNDGQNHKLRNSGINKFLDELLECGPTLWDELVDVVKIGTTSHQCLGDRVGERSMSVWNEHPEMLWIYFAFMFCGNALNFNTSTFGISGRHETWKPTIGQSPDAF